MLGPTKRLPVRRRSRFTAGLRRSCAGRATAHAQPWIVLTDLAPHRVGVLWYGLRMWIELGFRALKSMGWPWQGTRYWLGLAWLRQSVGAGDCGSGSGLRLIPGPYRRPRSRSASIPRPNLLAHTHPCKLSQWERGRHDSTRGEAQPMN